jgi:hypothetical protein
MSMQRQMPTLGQPIPARGPKLGATATGTSSR